MAREEITINFLFLAGLGTKKLGPCTQKYIEERNLESQLRNQITKFALPDTWKDDWIKWLERDKRAWYNRHSSAEERT